MTNTMTTTITPESLVEIGGSRWQKGEMDRVYFNDLADRFGLRASFYGTGNVSSASLNGEKISNTKATRMLAGFSLAKFWFDVPAGEFQSRGLHEDVHA